MIELFGVQRQTDRLRRRIDERLAAVFDHGQFILGPEVSELEERIGALVGAPHVVGVSSGRDALLIALYAEGVGPGDAVFVPSFTFSATAETVTNCGATPVFVDIDAGTFNMDADRLEDAIRTIERDEALRPRAVIPVDLYGLPADYGRISEIADKHGLYLIADAAQSFGGEMNGARVGSLAPVTTLSFYPTKPLGGFGDGGALICTDDALAERFRSLRVNGRGPSGLQESEIGMSGRLDTIQAAVLLCKLDIFEEEMARRREIADRYSAALADTVTVPLIPDGFESAFALYTIQYGNRDSLRNRLGDGGIGTGLYYPTPLHLHPAYRRYGCKEGDLPVTEAMSSQVLSLPMHPYLNDEEIDEVCRAVLTVNN